MAEEKTAPVQIWNTNALSQRFDYGLEAVIEEENRMAVESPVWRRHAISPQLIWHYSPRYDFAIGYENKRDWTDQVTEDEMGTRVDTVEEEENSGFFSGTVKLEMAGWAMESRQRFQWGLAEDGTTGEFRQKTDLRYEKPLLPFGIKPFVADEWSYDLLGSRELSQNELMMGFMVDFNRVLRVELFGLRMDEWDVAGNLLTTPVLGLKVSARF